MLKLLDIVYCSLVWLSIQTQIWKKYYCDGHYTILVSIKNLKLAIVLQMLSLGFMAFDMFS